MHSLTTECKEKQIAYFGGVLLTSEEKPAMYDSLSSVVHGREKLRLGIRINGLIKRDNADWVIRGEFITLEAPNQSQLLGRKSWATFEGDYSTISRTGSFPLFHQ